MVSRTQPLAESGDAARTPHGEASRARHALIDLTCSRRGDAAQIGLDAHAALDALHVRAQILSYGQLERSAVRQSEGALDEPFAEGGLAEQQRAAVVVQRRGEELRGGGGAAVDEQHQRLLSQQREIGEARFAQLGLHELRLSHVLDRRRLLALGGLGVGVSRTRCERDGGASGLGLLADGRRALGRRARLPLALAAAAAWASPRLGGRAARDLATERRGVWPQRRHKRVC
mmetsp:Transcript_56859/g.130580  ORF Transcript_56859/g.130580 Transcript_56859/m.130580 type:complete len:231 (-) Transcript_56859:1228-1920(-)